MQVKSIAECFNRGIYSAILLTFIELPFSIKTFVLSISMWPFYTVVTVSLFCLFLSDRFTQVLLRCNYSLQ